MSKTFDSWAWCFILALLVSIQHYVYTPPAGSIDFLNHYTHYNNFLIFRQSFAHLIHHQNLYEYYPKEYYDLYKYTPTFAVLIFPFAYLPNLAGLIFWNFINAFILFYALNKFPFSNNKMKLFAVAFVFIEALTSLMISESNCLLTGLILLVWLNLEKKNMLLATLFIVLSIFIKPFCLVFYSLFLFYPAKLKAIGYSVAWGLLFFILPLLFISPSELFNSYKSWGTMLNNDYSISYGLSIMSFLHSLFGVEYKMGVLFVGILLFILPLFRYKSFSSQTFKKLFLAQALIWVIIFNHKAESPGYIIAVTGVAIWFFSNNENMKRTSLFNQILLLLCFLFTILSPSDLYPAYIRNHFFLPYSIKAVPCIIIWIKIVVELLTKKFSLQYSITNR